MEVTLIAPPGDSMWWILRPEFIGFLDKIILDKTQFEEEKKAKDRSGYHSLVWERLMVLGDEDILELADLNINRELIRRESSDLLDEIFGDKAKLGLFTEDMIFAYEYWIDFNKLKTQLLPENQKYRKEILDSMSTWNDDLNLLLSMRAEAFSANPKLREHVAQPIIEKVMTLKQLNARYGKCAFAALKEYEPFAKYLHHEFDAPLLTEHTALTHKHRILQKNDGIVNLPAEPEYEFLKFNLSQRRFKDLLKHVVSNFRKARRKLKAMIQKTEEVAFGLSEGSIKHGVTSDFVTINRELHELNQRTRERSNYLSKSFSGLSLLPIPVLSQIFGLMSIGSKKTSELLESVDLSKLGFKPNGLSAYYGFLETLISVEGIEKFPEVKSANQSVGSSHFDDSFWRT